jgi:hypothetical protein
MVRLPLATNVPGNGPVAVPEALKLIVDVLFCGSSQ